MAFPYLITGLRATSSALVIPDGQRETLRLRGRHTFCNFDTPTKLHSEVVTIPFSVGLAADHSSLPPARHIAATVDALVER